MMAAAGENPDLIFSQLIRSPAHVNEVGDDGRERICTWPFPAVHVDLLDPMPPPASGDPDDEEAPAIRPDVADPPDINPPSVGGN